MDQSRHSIRISLLTQGPAGVPFGGSRSTSNCSYVELTSNTLNDILDGVITEVTRLEYLPLIKSSRGTVDDLISVFPQTPERTDLPAPDGSTSTQ